MEWAGSVSMSMEELPSAGTIAQVPLEPASIELAFYQNPRLVSKVGSIEPRAASAIEDQII